MDKKKVKTASVNGVQRPAVTVGKANPIRTRIARKAVGAGGFNLQGSKSRDAGMLIDTSQVAAPYSSGFKQEAYRTSYAYGLSDRTGSYDIPTYFVMMNEQNGGMLYWPVTLHEKYSWYRYWARSDAYIGRSLELLSDLPMSKLSLNMPKMAKKDKALSEEILAFFEYQLERINAFELCQSILFETNMIGNCFKGDTSILTSQGVMPISQIKDGDLVLDSSGSYSRVSKTMRRRVSEHLVDLGISKLNAFEFSPTREHPIFIFRDGKEVMVKAEEIHRGDWVGIGRVSEVRDVEYKKWHEELREEYLNKFYDTYEVDDHRTKCKYCVPTGIQEKSEEVREKIIAWVDTLMEPTTLECKEVAKIIGISDAIRVRSAAYLLSKKGEIKTQRTSRGSIGGSSIIWFPNVCIDGDRKMSHLESEFPVVANREIEIDEDFLYFLGYWLGDGWLWASKNKYAREFEGLDVCVSNKATDFYDRVNDLAKKIFGEDAVTNSPFIQEDNMSHVVIKDPMLSAWWNLNFGHDCKSKKLPEWVMRLPSEKSIFILKGMIDSDGCISKKDVGGSATISGSNKDLIFQLFVLGLSCGLPMSFNKAKERGLAKGCVYSSANMYIISVETKGYYEKIVEGCLKCKEVVWSDKNVVNPSFKEVEGSFYYRVDNVSRTYYEGYVYNLEVEGSHTYCANGVKTHNCYIFHEWDEEKKMWSRAVMLPPEEVYVFQYPFTETKRVEYRPQRLISLIQTNVADGRSEVPNGTDDRSEMNSKIVEGVPKELVDMVEKEGCIVMDTDPMTGSFVHHIARRRAPYMDLGASVLERVLVPMLQKEHYRYTQLSLASRNMTPKNLISAPGLMPEELEDLRTQVDLSYMDPEYSIITNYEVNWQQIGVQERFLDFSREYEQIENQVFAALGVTRELLTGEGQFSGTKITVEILNTMFLLTREVLRNYIEKQLFIPICEAHGWFSEDKNGAKKYFYPELGFNRLSIRDNAEVFDSLFQLYSKGSLPVEVIYELFNLNAEEMHNKLKGGLFTARDSTFNRMTEEMNSEAGRALVAQTDLVAKMAKYLGLKIVNDPMSEDDSGGQGDMYGDVPEEDVAGEQEDQPEDDAQPEDDVGATEEESKGDESPDLNPEDIAAELVKDLPADASDSDIQEAIDVLDDQ